MKLLLIGGGSGGHIYPLLSVAEYICHHNVLLPEEMHFIISDNGSDEEYFKNTQYSYTTFSVAKLRRYASLENIRDFFRFFKNIIHSFLFLKKHKPEKIFSKGGFVSLPFGISAFILQIPLILHETDASMGLSNTILSRLAHTVLTGFPSSHPHHIWVGNPVRNDFFIIPKKKQHHTPQIFIFGGSQGAQAINDWVRWVFKKYKLSATALLITGKNKKSNEHIEGIQEIEFLHDSFIENIHNADIVICRAGGSIAELAAAQKCSIFIPLPSAANDHQRKNAEYFARHHAALCIEQDDIYKESVISILQDLLKNPNKRQEYEQNIAKLATPNATKEIVKNLFPEWKRL